MSRIFDWIRTNWNEESNVGKAKLGAVVVLIFLLIAALLPDTGGRVPLIAPANKTPPAAADAQNAERQAAETYSKYEARVADLEHEAQTGAKAASSTYSTYEARIAELERANQALGEQLAAKDKRIAELEQGGAAAASMADSAANMELRLQLEAMRANLDALLKKLPAPQE